MYQVIQKDPALVLQGPQGLLRLYPVNENAVRVTQTGRDHFLSQPETENHTPVVLDKSPCPCYQVVEEAGAVTLKLKACSIRVDLATGALTYLAPTGEVLVREPRTGGRHLVETQVTRNIFSQDGELVELISSLRTRYEEQMEHYAFQNALAEIFKVIGRANKYIDENKPWALAKDEAQKPRLAHVLYNLLECVRLSAVLLTPFMPETCGKIFAQLGVDEGARTWESAGAWGLLPAGAAVSKGENLFPRIDVEKELAALDELQAAFLAAKLPHLDAMNAERRRIAARYLAEMHNPAVTLPAELPDCTHVWHIFAVRCADRNALEKHLNARGIGTNKHYPTPIHLQGAYAELGLGRGALPLAEEISATELSLPMFYGMTDAQVQAVIDAVNEFEG